MFQLPVMMWETGVVDFSFCQKGKAKTAPLQKGSPVVRVTESFLWEAEHKPLPIGKATSLSK